MDDLESLELLSLVTKVTAELQNHMGTSDRTLAEFLIDQRVECGSGSAFKKAIGDDLPASLIDSIDRLVKALHPALKKQRNGRTSGQDGGRQQRKEDPDEKAAVFKGLAIPDQEPDLMDDTFAMLESLAPGTKPDPRRADKSRSRSRSGSPYSRRQKANGRPRTRSPRDRNRDRDRRDRDRDRTRDRDRKRDNDRDRSRDRDRDRDGRRRRRDDSRDDYGRQDRPRRPAEPLDDQAEIDKIYTGRVSGITNFGAFVTMDGIRGRAEGLVHVSAIQAGVRINHPSDVVSKGEIVKVKVIKTDGGRTSLSMKDVDQDTGEDLAPRHFVATGANRAGLGDFDDPIANPDPDQNQDQDGGRGRNGRLGKRNRMTSPERWEIKQLIAAGALSAKDFPDIDEDPSGTTGANGEMAIEDEDIDIEVRDEEPPFLAGQTKLSLELSPIRVVKAPDGSLNRAAQAGDERIRERRELRDQAARDDASRKAADVDLAAQWQDPMAAERKFATELRPRPGDGDEGLPAWKQAIRDGDAAAPRPSGLKQRSSMTIAEQRESLPVFKFRQRFLDAVAEHQLLVVVGDTGSGKTTQLTQYLAEAGFARNGMIGCTQPRRVAAVSVAERVSKEAGVSLGAEVGYAIRFEDRTSSATKIKYMTDGIMQREILLDPLLTKYSVVMLDEAHERSIATDVLFGLLKKAVSRRADLKVIVTSATLDADKFSEYFNKCPIFTIPGRAFPVEVLYSREPETDYLDAALTTVMQIHLTEPDGDILLFLTGKDEIDTSCEILFERMKALGPAVPELVVLPIYGALPSDTANRIFDPAPPFGRKVVIATNIAETSITIDGIFYVIDPGFVKQSAYDAKLGMDRLLVTPISQAQAKQRSGRAGRTGPGKCFRLYTEAAYQSEMLPTPVPEIQRQNLATTILMLKAMGINDLLHFDFMDPPPTNTLLTALEELYALSALDDEGLLTRLGRQMSDFPMDPALSKTLIASSKLKCAEEVLTIVSMISSTTQSVFYRPKDKQQQADAKKAKFHDPLGDHLTLLNVFNRWKDAGFTLPWCYDNFLHPQVMRRVRDVREQLLTILDRHRLSIASCGSDRDKIRKALCAGFFRNAARKDPQEGYKTLVEGTAVYLHPASALFGKPAEHVIYHSLFETSREYMQYVTVIDPRWLAEAAPTFFRVAPSNRLSKRRREERIQPLANQYGRDDDWRLSTQRRHGRGGGGTWG